MVFTTVDKAAHTSAGICRKYYCGQVKKEPNSELCEKQEHEQGQIHEEQVDGIAAKQVMYLDDNMPNL